jgi:leucyl-tRNA synthetase
MSKSKRNTVDEPFAACSPRAWWSTRPIQVNGKKRADVTVSRDAPASEVEKAVLALDAVQQALGGKAPKRIVVVPQRIVNVVA